MSGMMEVPVTPPRGKGPAMAKGLLVLLGVSALLVPWGTAEAKPSSLVFDTDGEAPAAPPPAPPNAPLVSVGNPLDMCPPWAPGLGFMVRDASHRICLRYCALDCIPQPPWPGHVGRVRRAASSSQILGPRTALARPRRASPVSA